MKQNILLLLVVLVLGAITFWSLARFTPRRASLLIFNAKVYTVNGNEDVAEAVAVRGGRIVAVGTTADLRSRYRADTSIDAEGRPVFPGFIDAHGHVAGLGLSLVELNLVGTTSTAEIASLVAARVRAAKPESWIRGRGWDQNRWESKGSTKPFPTASMLDRVSPDNPVVLMRIDGHAAWANSEAMRRAGVTSATPDIDGGRIVRDAQGKPTGVFVDNAIDLIVSHVPQYTEAEIQQSYLAALNECLRYGLTGVGDMGIDEEDFAAYRALDSSARLPIRVYAAVGGNGEFWEKQRLEGPLLGTVGGRFVLRAVKMYIDGALGSRGAALLEPYSDEPDNRGLTVSSERTIAEVALEALRSGFQICTHAIGDRGNHIVLNAYEWAQQQWGGDGRGARMRIEHAQILEPSDLRRFHSLGVIPSMQPTHCTSDMYWAQARLGPQRIRGAYAWRSLLDDGNIIAGGSDFPVESPNPLLGFYAAITRQDTNGIPRNAADVANMFQLSSDGIRDSSSFDGGWYPAQRMTRTEALKAFTIWAATAEFAERTQGSIEPGKYADLVILSDDIMTIPALSIPRVRVVTAIVGGNIEYDVRGSSSTMASLNH